MAKSFARMCAVSFWKYSSFANVVGLTISVYSTFPLSHGAPASSYAGHHIPLRQAGKAAEAGKILLGEHNMKLAIEIGINLIR